VTIKIAPAAGGNLLARAISNLCCVGIIPHGNTLWGMRMYDYETSVTDATADDLKSEILKRFQPTGEDSLFNKLETQARGDLITLEYRQGLFSQMHVLTVRLRRLADNCAVYIDKRKASEDRQSIMVPDLESDFLGDYLAQGKSESLFDAIVDWLESNYGRANSKSPVDAAEPEQQRKRYGWDQLTKMERKVVLLIADGYTHRDIARDKDISVSVSTVKKHAQNIAGKLFPDGLNKQRLSSALKEMGY